MLLTFQRPLLNVYKQIPVESKAITAMKKNKRKNKALNIYF